MSSYDEVQQLEQEVRRIGDSARSEFGKLTTDQLNWKPSVDRWSVAQCLDHLITTNETYFPVFDSIVKGEKKSRLMERVPVLPKLFGRLFIKSLDPSAKRKLKAPAPFQPATSDISGSIVNDFVSHQAKVADTMVATKDLNPASIVITSPASSVITYSLMDAYRILVVHERRHMQQAQGVTEESAFPK
jgi:hypothetical protein